MKRRKLDKFRAGLPQKTEIVLIVEAERLVAGDREPDGCARRCNRGILLFLIGPFRAAGHGGKKRIQIHLLLDRIRQFVKPDVRNAVP